VAANLENIIINIIKIKFNSHMDVDQTTAYTGTIADGSALKSPKEFSAKK